MEIHAHLEQLYEDSRKCDDDNAFSGFLAFAAVTIAVCSGSLQPIYACWVGFGLLGVTLSISAHRQRALAYLQRCSEACDLGRRSFASLSKAENSYLSAAHFGILAEAGITLFALIQICYCSNPFVAALFGAIALASFIGKKRAKKFAADAALLKIDLRNRMREGLMHANAKFLPGDTALEKRYWFLKDDNEKPVATIATMYRGLCRSGLPAWKAFGTAVMSGISFGPKTQKGMSAQDKRNVGIRSRFDVYIPNLILAQSPSNSRIYAAVGNHWGIIPGDVDMKEFERMFAIGAPGLDYITVKAYNRIHKANQLRDKGEGKGNVMSRFMGKMAAKRRTDQLFMIYADRVVEEDGKLVPAISKESLLRFYQGAVQMDLLREHEEGDEAPAQPIPTGHSELAKCSDEQLAKLYRALPAGEVPDGDAKGQAIILSGTFVGKLLSAFADKLWKGKIVDRAHACLVNKLLGMHIVKAAVFKGASWSDAGEAVIVDYRHTSYLAFFIRDEIREVQAGLFLGKCYIRLPLGLRTNLLYFTLDFRN